MNKYRAAICGVLIAILGVFIVGCESPTASKSTTKIAAAGRMQLQQLLGEAGAVEYAKVSPKLDISFPSDHGAHPEYRSEWWYVTGNLSNGDGRDFGFQWTLFRSAIGQDQVYMAHFGFSDVAAQKHVSEQRFSVQGINANVSSIPYRAFLQDWQLQQIGDDYLPLQLQIQSYDTELVPYELELQLASSHPAVLQGDKGYSQKGQAENNASAYYSFTHLQVSGTVDIAGQSSPVTGSAWLDHEWGSSHLDDRQVGWDWFALQLANDEQLMLFQLRDNKGLVTAQSAGSWIQQGKKQHLSRHDFEISVLDYWQGENGRQYPAKWHIVSQQQAVDIIVTPRFNNQEMNLAVPYWEGSVQVRGSHAGVGYVELTGY